MNIRWLDDANEFNF